MCPAIGALLAPAEIYRGNVVPSKRPPWLPLPTNTVQDLADILLEGRRFLARKSKIDEKNLVLPSEAVKRNPIWMRHAETVQGTPPLFCGPSFRASLVPSNDESVVVSREEGRQDC